MASQGSSTLSQQPKLPTQSSDYAITITDCNSITKARITLRRASLNIKYGPNGIGKSTIARALVLTAQGSDALQELLPFKYRQDNSGKAPAVVGADEIKSALVFDEHYVSQFVFQPDEVVKNSFEIFINTPEYQAGIEELEAIFEDLKKVFLENQQGVQGSRHGRQADHDSETSSGLREVPPQRRSSGMAHLAVEGQELPRSI